MGDGWGGFLLFGLGGWLQRRRAEKAASSVLPPGGSAPTPILRRSESNPMAVLAIVAAAIPFLILLAIGLSGTTSDAADELFYWSSPVCGTLAVGAGLAARGRSGRSGLARAALVIGALEVVVAIVIGLALLLAFRTLG
jgi:peptidoglycan/LPS O-acetylase OafA/YrhL